ncbi:NUDIX hydrolase [Arcanobacterium ihumii]|uniref:NUDIX hydrolase n=1 Tax=Arcanobacterium ihumii TaxID=2138162 RepID=UPI001F36A03A|nr:NUDIX domain-containing protein [Arcanobacterium ihumii]
MDKVSQQNDIRDQVFQEMEREWPVDDDGFPHRQAARVVVIDSKGDVFLIKGHDFGDSNRSWWFTVGGGKANGESDRQAALRELQEETGLAVSEDRLEGPVLRRESTFRFVLRDVKQDEMFFLLRVTDAEKSTIDRDGNSSLTLIESEVLEEYRWWNLDELQAAIKDGETVYPVSFISLAKSWVQGWDGKLSELLDD